jgi:hypothetical protein
MHVADDKRNPDAPWRDITLPPKKDRLTPRGETYKGTAMRNVTE